MMNQKSIAPHIMGDLRQINFSIDDFRRVREEGFLYVDKTKMIEDILTYDKGKAVLFTRPRRFGKSLNLSMLRYFFDMAEDSKELFKGLYMEQSKFFQTHLNRYPVIYLNFKNIVTDTVDDVKGGIISCLETISEQLCKKYQCKELESISFQSESGTVNTLGAEAVMRILSEKTGRRVIVLVDEYDSVVNRAYGTDGWKKAAGIVKELFGALFKSNEYLEMGVLTGVSRIGKELGFSDMNNLVVYGLTNELYYEYFGFTEEEVKELLRLNKIEISDLFYRMYNGYHIGKAPNMFNPASMLQFLFHYQRTGEAKFSSYWINSSANSILKDNIAKQNAAFKNSLLSLLDGGTVTEPVFESIDYEMLHKPSHMYSLLIDTGYLCPVRQAGMKSFELKIPNEEVLYGYVEMIDLITGVNGEMLDALCRALAGEDTEQFEKILNKILLTVSSFHDLSEKENSYHNLVTGALLYMIEQFKLSSNRESGEGRYDLAVIPNEKGKHRPVIIEFKAAGGKKKCSEKELLALAGEALAQIESRQYAAGYTSEYKKEDFLLVGIGAQGKRCKVAAK